MQGNHIPALLCLCCPSFPPGSVHAVGSPLHMRWNLGFQRRWEERDWLGFPTSLISHWALKIPQKAAVSWAGQGASSPWCCCCPLCSHRKWDREAAAWCPAHVILLHLLSSWPDKYQVISESLVLMRAECVNSLSKVLREAAKREKPKPIHTIKKSMSDQNEAVRVTLLMKRNCLHGVIDEWMTSQGKILFSWESLTFE